ncbi:hypothetical protein KQX54_011894 [Cotesia glomerata]|uniref:Uncharacterized protein n=1 Tax=Cotesia glomerata TaxID=32391 RepID=A0AAV7J6G6_COTGL|nr:hypothetical protein KQX54_011894 [Cotesia glomerata]
MECLTNRSTIGPRYKTTRYFVDEPGITVHSQGLIAGRKQLGLVEVVKPSLRGVTGSATCKSRSGCGRVPVAALGEPVLVEEGVMGYVSQRGSREEDYTCGTHIFMDRKCLRLQPIKILFLGFDSPNNYSITLFVSANFTML